MTVPGSLFVIVVASLIALRPVQAQQWLPWQGRASQHGADPAKQLASGSMQTLQRQTQPSASVMATRVAAAQPGPVMSEPAKPEPVMTASAPAVTNPAIANPGVATGQLFPTHRKSFAATNVARQPVAVVSTKMPSAGALLAPASVNPPVITEPLLPAVSGVPMQAREIVISTINEGSAAGPVIDTDVAAIQIISCDEIGRCERLDTLRSGVGVEGPRDEANKRRPDNDAKRHVMQSVRSVW